MNRCGGYVLVTCLYVVAVLSVSSLALVRSASLMSAGARLLDQQQSLAIAAHQALNQAEALNLVASSSFDCRGTPELSVQTQVLHERTVSRFNAANERISARYRIYGVRACAHGRAFMETTFGIFEPAGVFDGDDLPTGVRLGRLSWRRVW